ncbi:MAG TPA: DUF1315 family protein [Cellvibrionaceae bacterium]
MNELQQLLGSLSPAIYHNLKRAVELGKWPDGKRLTSEQIELCMQAIIVYEHKHFPTEQHSGFIPPKPHQHCGSDEDDEKPLSWQ